MSQVSTYRKELRATRWLAAINLMGALLLSTLAALGYFSEGMSVAVAGCAVLAVFCLLGAIDGLTTRVELNEESLVVVKNLRRRVYLKSDFYAVAWSKGQPPALQFLDGRWLKLPTSIPGGLGPANTIKAWLKSK